MSPLPPEGPVPPAPGSADAGGSQTSTEPAPPSRPAVAGSPASPNGARSHRRGAKHGRRRSRRWVVEWVIVIAVALVVAFVVRTYVAQTFFVPSTSMYPTLKDGDRIVVDKLAYSIHAVHRGDIVVFKTPPTEHCGGPPVPDLVKRVIGLPGETISGRAGQVYITGHLLKEPWLPRDSNTYTSTFTPVHIPPHDYFMMGDNRVASCDSRMWGPVNRSYFVGKVDLIIWPPGRWRFF